MQAAVTGAGTDLSGGVSRRRLRGFARGYRVALSSGRRTTGGVRVRRRGFNHDAGQDIATGASVDTFQPNPGADKVPTPNYELFETTVLTKHVKRPLRW